MSERSRLISAIRIAAGENDTLVASTSVTRQTVIPPGTYWPTGDGTATDIYAAIEAALLASWGLVWTITLIGVHSDELPNLADGRIRSTQTDLPWSYDTDHSAWTLDAGILGLTQGKAGGYPSSQSAVLSPWRHRFGYYPHVFASERFRLPIDDRGVFFSTGGYPDSRALPAWEELNLTYRDVPACFVRPEAAILPDWLAESFGLTLGDPYATWARFWFDVTDGADESLLEPRNLPPNQAIRSVRFYPDATKAAYSGPWVLHPNSPIWSRPLDPPSRPEGQAGETWSLVASMRSHPASGLD